MRTATAVMAPNRTKSHVYSHVDNLQCCTGVALLILPSAVEVGGTGGSLNLLGVSYWCLRQCNLKFSFHFIANTEIYLYLLLEYQN